MVIFFFDDDHFSADFFLLGKGFCQSVVVTVSKKTLGSWDDNLRPLQIKNERERDASERIRNETKTPKQKIIKWKWGRAKLGLAMKNKTERNRRRQEIRQTEFYTGRSCLYFT